MQHVVSRLTAAQRTPATHRTTLQSLERGLGVLEYLNLVGSARAPEIARELGLPRATASRILGVLTSMGLLRLDAASRHYFLTAEVLELSNGYQDESWITELATPLMRDWSRQYRWPLVLVTPVDGALTVRASTDHEHAISVDHLFPGAIISPEGSTAAVLLTAFSARPLTREQETLIRQGLDVPDAATIRAQGYVAAHSVCYSGSARIVVPLFRRQEVLGTITMRCIGSCIDSPHRTEQWASSLKRLARRIESSVWP